MTLVEQREKMNIKKAIKLTQAATPGSWYCDHSFDFSRNPYKEGLMPVAEMRGWGYLTGRSRFACHMEPDIALSIQHANAAFIACFNPPTVRAMLQFIEEYDTPSRHGLAEARIVINEMFE